MCASVSTADYLAWDYDMQSLPPGWQADSRWSFGTSGAHCQLNCPEGSTTSMYGFMSSGTDVAAIAADADSVVLEASMWLEAGAVGYGSDYYVAVRYSIDGGDWNELWIHDGPGLFEGPIQFHSSIPISPPCSVGVRFSGHAQVPGISPSYWSWVGWTIHDLTLTVYDGTGLEPETWGSIKVLF